MFVQNDCQTIPPNKESEMPDARKKDQLADDTGPRWVSLNEATKLLDKNRETVLQLGISGVLKVEKMGRWTFVTRESIERYLVANAAAVAQ